MPTPASHVVESPQPPPDLRDRFSQLADAFEPLPHTAARLVGLLGQTEWMLRDVEDVVRQDLAVTSRVLRMANAAWTAHLPPVSTLRDALMRTGVGTVLSMAVSDAVRPKLLKPLPLFDLQAGRLWQHAVASAAAAEVVARRSRCTVPPEAVTAALLHDVGKLVIDAALDDTMRAALREAWADVSLSRLDAERRVLGMHHGEVGGLVARHWNLPESIVWAITAHHSPGSAPTTTGDVVHLANGLAKICGFGPLVAELEGPIDPAVLERLGLGVVDLQGLCADLAERMRTGLERFN